MQPASSAKPNRAPEVAPAIRPSAPWRLTSVTPLPGFRRCVEFVDGSSGEVELAAFLHSPPVDGTIFEPLRGAMVFAQVQVILN